MKIVMWQVQMKRIRHCEKRLTFVQSIARHVLNVHMNKQTQDAVMGEIGLEKMKAYVNYCKA